MAENINANRIAAYKNHSKNSQEMLRMRRHEVTVELRKNKKDDQLFKRRNIVDLEPTSPLQEINGQSPATLSIEEIVTGIHSSDPKQQYLAAHSARKILSQERNPPIDLIIKHGIVPVLTKFLECHEHPDLQFEATWTLTNLASGTSEQTKTVVDAGGIPKLVLLLESPVSNVADQAVWALGNIAGDGPDMRDLVLSNNVVERLIALLAKDIKLTFEQNIVWLMSNLCRNKNPHPPFEKIKPMLPVLAQYLFHHDTNLLADVCWALSYISDDDNDKIHAIIQAGVLPPLIKLLGSPEAQVVTPALRTVGNIVTGTDIQTDAVLEAGALPYLKELLKNSKPNIVKEAAWTVSNIAAGNRNQIQTLFAAEIFQEIVNVLAHGDFRSQKEAAWAITNTTTGGSFEQVVNLVKLNLLDPFCKLLDVKEQRTIKVVLNGIENMLALTEKHGGLNDLCILIEEANGLDKLEQLQNHENEEIYQKAYEIVEKYFSEAGTEGVSTNGAQNFEFNAGDSATVPQQQQQEVQHTNGGQTFSF